MDTEIELKLATSKTGLRKTLALPWLRRMAGDEIRRQRLISVYFDTQNLALHRRGVSLRVRHTGGRRLQTIKANSAEPMTRGEWEAEIDRDRPNLTMARGTPLASIITDEIARHLKPMLETRIHRTVMPLRMGNSEIELALDEGRVATAGSSIDIAEIEIELKQGERGDMARLARKLAHEVPATLGARAKAELGYALLEGTISAPVSAEPIAIATSATAADAFAAVGFACLRQIAGNEAAVRNGDPEGIHQMRVGLRRLRAAVSLFRDMLQGKETGAVKSELRWLTDQLGPGRDSDVFVRKTVAPYLERHPGSSEFEVLLRDLEMERRAGFTQAKAAAKSDRFRHLLLDCGLWLIDGRWRSDADELKMALRRRPAAAFAEEELARRTRRIIKRARKLRRLDARRRHKLRIAVKKVRYARGFFASLDPGGPRRKARRKVDRSLKELQSALGSLNDMRVHMQRARSFANAGAESRKAFAIGFLTGREEVHADKLLTKALTAGRSLKKAA